MDISDTGIQIRRAIFLVKKLEFSMRNCNPIEFHQEIDVIDFDH